MIRTLLQTFRPSLCLLIGLLLFACSSASPPPAPKPPARPKPVAAKAPVERPKPPPGALWREDVLRTVEDGLGRFLQRVVVDAELRSGKFVGFRIVELRPLEWWKEVDLRPGDVVLRVNGMPIERETQAYEAFESLKKADHLTVTYLRAGEERQLSYRIIEK